jgi:hypothetical protein
MDPITTAIIAALPVLASELVKSSVKDAYAGLKAVILRKWGGEIRRCFGGEPEIERSGGRTC